MELHKQYGNKWVQIQKYMPGRNDNDIKNRYNACLRKYHTREEYVESQERKKEKPPAKKQLSARAKLPMKSPLEQDGRGSRSQYELRNQSGSKKILAVKQEKDCKEFSNSRLNLEDDDRSVGLKKGYSQTYIENEHIDVEQSHTRHNEDQKHDGSKSDSHHHAARLRNNLNDHDVQMEDDQSKRKSSRGKSLSNYDANSNDNDIEKDYTDTIERYRKSYNAQKNQQQNQKDKDKKMCTPSDRSLKGQKGKNKYDEISLEEHNEFMSMKVCPNGRWSSSV